MLDPVVRSLPLFCFYPLRLAAARMPRRSVVRKACVLMLKGAQKAHRNTLMKHLSEVRPLDAPELRFSPANSMVLEAVYWYGVRGYEGVVSRIWASLASRSRSTLEIGGNVGLYAAIGGRLAPGSYTVVERVPGVAAHLRQNVALNGATRVEVIEAAVIPGDTEHPVLLNIPNEKNDVPVGSHLIEGVEVSGRSSNCTIKVRGIPFRNLSEGRDLIKIDAEGIESEILRSAIDIIENSRPSLIVEVLPESQNLAATISEFARLFGYEIWALPEFGYDDPVLIDVADFSASTPARFNAKDVLLRVCLESQVERAKRRRRMTTEAA